MPADRKALKFGDVIEIPVPGVGAVYVQYRADNPPPLGMQVVRVFAGPRRQRPLSTAALVAEEEVFHAIIPLRAAVRDGRAVVIDHEPLPTEKQGLPPMKATTVLPTGRVRRALWEPELGRLRRVEAYSDDERRFSEKVVIGTETLVNRVLTGWRPEDAEQRRTGQSSAVHEMATVEFFSYLPAEAAARAAALELQESAMVKDIRNVGGEWLLHIELVPRVASDVTRARDHIQQVVRRHGGVLDGDGFAV